MTVYRVFWQGRLCICTWHTLGIWYSEDDKSNVAFGYEIGAITCCQIGSKADAVYDQTLLVCFYKTQSLSGLRVFQRGNAVGALCATSALSFMGASFTAAFHFQILCSSLSCAHGRISIAHALDTGLTMHMRWIQNEGHALRVRNHIEGCGRQRKCGVVVHVCPQS